MPVGKPSALGPTMNWQLSGGCNGCGGTLNEVYVAFKIQRGLVALCLFLSGRVARHSNLGFILEEICSR